MAFEILPDPHPPMLITISKHEYVRLVNAARKSANRKRSLRRLQKAHDVNLWVCQSTARKSNDANRKLDEASDARRRPWWAFWRAA